MWPHGVDRPSFPDTGENILCRGVVKLDGSANIEAAPVPFNSSVSISLGPFAEVDIFKNALHEVTSAQLSLQSSSPSFTPIFAC